jgi:hypothetical protein
MRLLVLLAVLVCSPAACLVLPGPARTAIRATRAVAMSSRLPEPPEEASIASKAVWYGTELFGKLAAAAGQRAAVAAPDRSGPPGNLEEAVARLAVDYAGSPDDPRPYFLTGRMDAALYADDCEFSDPFGEAGGCRATHPAGTLGRATARDPTPPTRLPACLPPQSRSRGGSASRTI